MLSLLLAAAVASATPNDSYIDSPATFVAMCKQGLKGKTAEDINYAAVCAGTIRAVAETVDFADGYTARGRSICIPHARKISDALDAVLALAEREPESLKEADTTEFILVALMDASPCK